MVRPTAILVQGASSGLRTVEEVGEQEAPRLGIVAELDEGLPELGEADGEVEMSMETEAQAAIAKLNGQPYGGRRLTVNIANPQGERSGGSRSTGTRLGGARGAARRPVRW